MKMTEKLIYIRDFYPLKAQFLRNEPVGMAVELVNRSNFALEAELELVVSFLTETIDVVRMPVTIEPGELTVNVLIVSKDEVFKGYGADLSLYSQHELLDIGSGSFDVVSSWRKSPRYGFLSDFYIKDENDSEDVKSLRKLHINLVQFYDWMYKHDELVPPVPEYTDLMGRKVSLKAVTDKISYCHEYGMKAVAYGAVYAASGEFYKSHPDWALYSSSGNVVDFINIFRIMNISEECPWHGHIIGEYRKTIEKLNFDGIHMDTYGFPKTGISIYGGTEKPVKLEEHFPVLIAHARKELEQTGKDICLIFNNVGNWPVDAVAQAPQDALYIEVWKPYERYQHIQQLILRAKELGGGKPVILAAYLKPFLEEMDHSLYRAENSALLLTAAIAANGGYHMLLGEKGGILTQGYYVDYARLSEPFFSVIRSYYDFMIRYLNVLFVKDLKDVSMTHVDGDNLEYAFENVDYSTYAGPGKVWIIVRESRYFKTVSLINLSGNDDFWNRGKEKPWPVKNIQIRIQVESRVKSVFIASPDSNAGRTEKVEYSIEDGNRGKTLSVNVRQLDVWSLLVLEMEKME